MLHGNRTYLLQDEDGQILENALGLGRPGLPRCRPRARLAHGHLGRAEYVTITDDEALAAFHSLCRLEGIIPALESSHALAYAAKLAPTLPKDKILLVNLSGRGDKDMHTSRRTFRPPVLNLPRAASAARSVIETCRESRPFSSACRLKAARR